MRIGIDVDDVVADLLTAWLEKISAAVGKVPAWTPDDITQWEFWNDLGLDSEVIWNALTPDIYERVRPHDGAAWAMEELRKAGHRVVFVTSSRSKAAFQAKVEWLLTHDVMKLSDEVHAVAGWAEYNTKADPRLKLDVLLDDHLGNLDGFPGYPVLMTRTHNRRAIVKHKRVRNLADFVAWAKVHDLKPRADTAIDEVMDSYNYAADHCAGGAEGGACWTKPVNVGGELLDRDDLRFEPGHQEQDAPVVRVFSTGANRDVDTGKLDYEGFLSPLALKSFAEYMHRNRYLRDGSIRDSDNWQKGIPLDVYMKSMFRHFFEVWTMHRNGYAAEPGQPDPLETALDALFFNVQGYLHETKKANSLRDKVA